MLTKSSYPMSERHLTENQIKYIEHMSRVIARMEEHGAKESTLKFLIYNLGVYAFRGVHRAGPAVDDQHPGLTQPRKIYSPILGRYIDERKIREVEAQAIAENRIALAA